MPKPEDKSYTLSHYGAKDEDSSPVEAAYEPKSYAAILEGWEGVQGVRAIYAYPRGCRHSLLDHNHLSTSAGTINQAGNAVARTMLTTIMSNYYLAGNRRITASQDIWFTNH